MLAGVTWPDMPKIDRYVEGNTNKLCYNYILGKCTSRYCTHRQGHAPATEITNDFATTLCTALRPGLDGMTEALMTASWPEFQNVIASRRARNE